MQRSHRIFLIIAGAIILFVSYLYTKDIQSGGIIAVMTNPGTYGLFLGVILCIIGLLKGRVFSKKAYYVLGTVLIFCGWYLIYGGISNTYSHGIQMRDMLFSPGITLMGVGMFIIAKTWLGKRL